MKKIGFIGGTDKSNLIVYVAKILNDLNKRVLVIDTTRLQKMKYIVPAINPTKSYITDFENTDYAVGFDSMQNIMEYLGIKDMQGAELLPYDYILIDIDDAKTIENFELEDTKDHFFVTTFDMYSIQKGIEILRNLPFTMNLSKILLNYNMKKDDEQYLSYLALDTKTIWNDFSIYMPILDENEQAIQDNQRIYRTRVKKLIPEYQEGLIYIVQNIVKDYSANKIKKIIKE